MAISNVFPVKLASALLPAIEGTQLSPPGALLPFLVAAMSGMIS